MNGRRQRRLDTGPLGVDEDIAPGGPPVRDDLSTLTTRERAALEQGKVRSLREIRSSRPMASGLGSGKPTSSGKSLSQAERL